MATTDPLTGATINDQNDVATGGFQVGRVITELRKFLVPRFSSDAARDTAYGNTPGAGGDGATCWSNSRFMGVRAGAWRKLAGAREVLYDNGDVGSSGLVGQSNSFSDIFTLNFTSPVAADTGHVHASIAVQPSGSASTVFIQVAGSAGWSYIQRADCALNVATPIVLEVPVSLAAGSQVVVVRMKVSSGGSSLVQHAAVRVSI